MIRWLALLFLCAAAYAGGTLLLRNKDRLVLDGWARKTLVRGGLGFGLLAYAVLLLGWLHLARTWAVILLGLALIAAAAPLWVREARDRARMRAREADTPVAFGRDVVWPHAFAGGRWHRLLSLGVLVVLGLLLLAGLLRAFAGPAAYDDLTYHLAAPKVYAATGQVTILPYDHHTAFPLTLEMLYLAALLLAGAELALLVNLVIWLLALLAIFVLGRDYLGPRVGWLAVLAYGCTPLVFYQVGTGYTEFGFALYQLLAWLCFLDYLNLRFDAVTFKGDGTYQPKARQPQWIGLAGVFAGLTYGMKYTGALAGLFLLAALLVLGRRDRLKLPAIRSDALVFSLSALLVAAPWIARTWVGTGNPVFPFAHGVFGSPKWSEDRAEMYQGAQDEFGRAFRITAQGGIEVLEPSPTSHRSFGRLLTAPWNVTFFPSWFYDRGLNYDGKARLGPFYLVFVLPAFLLWLRLRRRGDEVAPSYTEIRDETVSQVYSKEFGREVEVARARRITERTVLDTGRVVALLLAHLIGIGVLWFYSMQHSRYLVPHLALWSLLAAWGADGMLRLPISAIAATAAILGQLAGGLAYAQLAVFPALRVQLGSLSPDAYAAGGLPAYRAMQWLNQNTGPDAKVILFAEPRGYWLDLPYLWGERGHSTIIPDSARQSMTAYLDYLTQNLGVTHALILEPAFPTDQPDRPDDVGLIGQAIAAGRMAPVYREEGRGVVVYELR